MKRIKSIIESLKIITDTPSRLIEESAAKILTSAAPAAGAAGEVEHNVVAKLLDAIVSIAKDLERPAKGTTEETQS